MLSGSQTARLYYNLVQDLRLGRCVHSKAMVHGLIGRNVQLLAVLAQILHLEHVEVIFLELDTQKLVGLPRQYTAENALAVRIVSGSALVLDLCR